MVSLGMEKKMCLIRVADWDDDIVCQLYLNIYCVCHIQMINFDDTTYTRQSTERYIAYHLKLVDKAEKKNLPYQL